MNKVYAIMSKPGYYSGYIKKLRVYFVAHFYETQSEKYTKIYSKDISKLAEKIFKLKPGSTIRVIGE